MDLNGATWMVRQLEQSVSMVHLDEHQGVFAGGWDGRLTLRIQASGYRTQRSVYTGDTIETVTFDALSGSQARKVLFVGTPPCVLS